MANDTPHPMVTLNPEPVWFREGHPIMTRQRLWDIIRRGSITDLEQCALFHISHQELKEHWQPTIKALLRQPSIYAASDLEYVLDPDSPFVIRWCDFPVDVNHTFWFGFLQSIRNALPAIDAIFSDRADYAMDYGRAYLVLDMPTFIGIMDIVIDTMHREVKHEHELEELSWFQLNNAPSQDSSPIEHSMTTGSSPMLDVYSPTTFRLADGQGPANTQYSSMVNHYTQRSMADGQSAESAILIEHE